jgi:hypothetical protein
LIWVVHLTLFLLTACNILLGHLGFPNEEKFDDIFVVAIGAGDWPDMPRSSSVRSEIIADHADCPMDQYGIISASVGDARYAVSRPASDGLRSRSEDAAESGRLLARRKYDVGRKSPCSGHRGAGNASDVYLVCLLRSLAGYSEAVADVGNSAVGDEAKASGGKMRTSTEDEQGGWRRPVKAGAFTSVLAWLRSDEGGSIANEQCSNPDMQPSSAGERAR